VQLSCFPALPIPTQLLRSSRKLSLNCQASRPHFTRLSQIPDLEMLVEKTAPELEASHPAYSLSLRRTESGRNRHGFVAEEDFNDYSSDYSEAHQLDVKNLRTLEHLPEPDIAHPPSYEESETSPGIDENGTPHHITVRSLSISDPAALPKHPHVWQIKRTTVTLSALEATVLVKAGILDYKDLRL
jgi:hypothetical protein